MNEVKLLVCDCEDCTHWEITKNGLICKTCGLPLEIPGLGNYIDRHTENHPKLSWDDHKRELQK